MPPSTGGRAMADGTGRRPGGLTALTILNFVFGAFGLIGVATLAYAMTDPEFRETFDKSLREPATDQWLAIMIAAGAIEALLLLLSAIGFLGQRLVLGRIVGSVYGIWGLAENAYMVSVAGFDITTMIGIVYPLLTLVLVNTTFRDDLVR
jgi:hypothetical protein